MNKKVNARFLCSNFIKSKKGDGKIVSVYWFAILFIVAASIVYMVALFYGNPYDVRGFESRALSNKVADCVSRGGYIDETFLSDSSLNLLEKCNLIFDVEDSYGWTKDSEYYIEIEMIYFNNNSFINNIKIGNSILKDYCDPEYNTPNFPFCLERSFYSVNRNNDNQYIIKITSIVRKTEKNVR